MLDSPQEANSEATEDPTKHHDLKAGGHRLEETSNGEYDRSGEQGLSPTEDVPDASSEQGGHCMEVH